MDESKPVDAELVKEGLCGAEEIGLSSAEDKFTRTSGLLFERERTEKIVLVNKDEGQRTKTSG